MTACRFVTVCVVAKGILSIRSPLPRPARSAAVRRPGRDRSRPPAAGSPGGGRPAAATGVAEQVVEVRCRRTRTERPGRRRAASCSPEQPQVTLSASLDVPQTMLSTSPLVPHTMLSHFHRRVRCPTRCCRTLVGLAVRPCPTRCCRSSDSPIAACPRRCCRSRRPPHSVPHTMLSHSSSPQAVPHTMLSQSSPSRRCPTRCCRLRRSCGRCPRRCCRRRAPRCPRRCCRIRRSAHSVPHTMLSPSASSVAPQTVLSAQALPVGLMTPLLQLVVAPVIVLAPLVAGG